MTDASLTVRERILAEAEAIAADIEKLRLAQGLSFSDLSIEAAHLIKRIEALAVIANSGGCDADMLIEYLKMQPIC